MDFGDMLHEFGDHDERDHRGADPEEADAAGQIVADGGGDGAEEGGDAGRSRLLAERRLLVFDSLTLRLSLCTMRLIQMCDIG
jgi:hypothetical protein